MKILLVEDDRNQDHLFRTALNFLGFASGTPEVISAATAEEGLDQLQNAQPIDMAFVDIDLEGSSMNGIEMTSQIKQSYPQTEVIVFTASSKIDDMNAAKAAGADEFIAKQKDFDNFLLDLNMLLHPLL
ncbi:MAG: response regulator [Bacteroidota bacterium]